MPQPWRRSAEEATTRKTQSWGMSQEKADLTSDLVRRYWKLGRKTEIFRYCSRA